MNRSGLTTRDRARQAPPSPAPRPVRRRRPPMRRGRRRALQGLAIALVVAAGVWVLAASPLLGVRLVRVDGADAPTAVLVRRAAAVPEGRPLLRVDVDAVARRVAALEQVADVRVDRGWPHSVVVTVREREPVAVMGSGTGRRWLDADGVVFSPAGSPPDGVVPLTVPGAPTDAPARAAAASLAALPEGLRARVAGASATTTEDLSLRLTGGPTVLWGGSDGAAHKAQVLAALLDQLGRGALGPAGTVDVSAPDAVVLR